MLARAALALALTACLCGLSPAPAARGGDVAVSADRGGAGTSLSHATAPLDRPPVLTDDEHWTFRAIGRLNVRGFSAARMCNATLVASDLALTAAHCLWDEARGLASPAEVRFIAGWLRGEDVARREAASFEIHPAFATTERGTAAHAAADIALVRLARPIPAERVAPLPLAAAQAVTPPLALIGYRGDRPHALSGQWDCDVIWRRDALLVTDCAAIGGSSGSPVLTRAGGGFAVAAVTVAVSGGRTVAARPTEAMRALVAQGAQAQR